MDALDRLIAERLCRWQILEVDGVLFWTSEHTVIMLVDNFHPSTNIGQCFEFVWPALEKRGYSYLLASGLDGHKHGCMLTQAGHPDAEPGRCYSETPEVAFCKAAKKALAPLTSE